MFSPISIDYSVISFKYYSIRMQKETLFSNSDQLFKTILTRIHHLFSIYLKTLSLYHRSDILLLR